MHNVIKKAINSSCCRTSLVTKQMTCSVAHWYVHQYMEQHSSEEYNQVMPYVCWVERWDHIMGKTGGSQGKQTHWGRWVCCHPEFTRRVCVYMVGSSYVEKAEQYMTGRFKICLWLSSRSQDNLLFVIAPFFLRKGSKNIFFFKL
jgi:hypothetical protein